MSTILAGRFDNTAQVQAVLAELKATHFGRCEFASYYINPPGQYGLYPLGGDEFADPRASQAGGGAAKGAALGGAAGRVMGGETAPIMPRTGAQAGAQAETIAPMAAGGVGAYLGSLIGALNRLQDGSELPDAPQEPGAGPMVAICVDRPGTEQIARATLHRHGAHAIERVEGIWEDGDWKDFDPLGATATMEG